MTGEDLDQTEYEKRKKIIINEKKNNNDTLSFSCPPKRSSGRMRLFDGSAMWRDQKNPTSIINACICEGIFFSSYSSPLISVLVILRASSPETGHAQMRSAIPLFSRPHRGQKPERGVPRSVPFRVFLEAGGCVHSLESCRAPCALLVGACCCPLVEITSPVRALRSRGSLSNAQENALVGCRWMGAFDK